MLSVIETERGVEVKREVWMLAVLAVAVVIYLISLGARASLLWLLPFSLPVLRPCSGSSYSWPGSRY